MKIGPIDLDQEVMIVAEVGNNHEGSFALAEEMVGRAAETGVHAIKFQTIIPERLVSSSQKERIQQLKRFQFSAEQFQRLAELAGATISIADDPRVAQQREGIGVGAENGGVTSYAITNPTDEVLH